MNVEQKKVFVPARTYTKTEYTARDGQVFGSEKECLKYEELLDLKESMLTIPFKYVDFFGEYDLRAYYIKDIDEFDKVLKKITGSRISMYRGCKFEKENWYLFKFINGGDYNDEWDCETLNYYKQEIQEFLKEFE